MGLKLTPEILKSSYEFLETTEPFCRWNLPDSDDVTFLVVKTMDCVGYYTRDDNGKHIIAISESRASHTLTLVETMAHEMIHLHQGDVKMETKGMHNAAFRKLSERVAKIHGFDPKYFFC